MKKFKKISAAIAASLMAASMIAPATINFVSSAADSANVSVLLPTKETDIKEVTDAKAIKIFTVSSLGDAYETTDTEWYSTAVKNAIIDYFNTEKSSDDNDYVNDLTPKEAFAKISAFRDDSPEAEALAKALANVTLEGGKVAKVGEIAADKKSATFTNLDNGYYVVLATVSDGATTDAQTTKSLGMLTVVNGAAVTRDAKVALPSVQKKVKEDDKGATTAAKFETSASESKLNAWNDKADLEIGQDAEFRLYGTLPSNYDKYKTYYYCFSDSLDEQFDAVILTSIKVKAYADEAAAKAGTTFEDITEKFIIKAVNASGNETEEKTANKFNIKCNDLKTIKDDNNNAVITEKSVIVVEYKSALNANAIVASTGGQENGVTLTYSNNPNKQGDGETTTTPEDKVIVYTYDLEIDKTFTQNKSPLTQEEIAKAAHESYTFTLKKPDGKDDENNDKYKYLKLANIDVPAGYDYYITGTSSTANDASSLSLQVYDGTKKLTKSETADENGIYTYTYTEGNTTTTYMYDAENKNWKINDSTDTTTLTLAIKIKGTDSDTYILHETASEGAKYNTITDATEKIYSELDFKQNYISQGKNVKVNYGFSDDYKTAAKFEVENQKGSTLPSTGGIGTTLFYLGGGAMVAIAGVFLITKKRMGKDEA